jgi:hypothetical protein
MLAPPFTKETAKEKGRLGGINSGLSKRNAKLLASLASEPSIAQKRIALQVHKVTSWMEKEHNKDKYAQLCAMLDRLWDMAYPKQAPAKGRQGQRRTTPLASETPQEPASSMPVPGVVQPNI